MGRGICLSAVAGLLVVLCGCPPQGESVAPQDRREALERVNNNLVRLQQPLQYKALVSFSFEDEQGRTRRFLGQEAALLYRGPQSLRFDVRSLTGVVAQFGSNDTRFWVWIEPELRKMWWGEWRSTTDGSLRRLPIPPTDLLDALMLRPLPESLQGGLLPLLRKEGDDHRLIFVRLGPDRQPSGWREIRLDPRAPYQPLEITDRTPEGKLVMHARLSNYQPVDSGGPVTPRSYVVDWPENRAEMRMDILSAAWRADLPSEVFEFPEGWRGEQERIDVPLRPATAPEAAAGQP